MRWDHLFADLEAQLDTEARRERDLEVADRTRRERALIGLHERLLATMDRGTAVELQLVAADGLRGKVADVGADWLLLDLDRRCALVPFGAIVALSGLSSHAGASRALAKRFGLGHALRGLCRDRAVVTVTDLTGSQLTGTIDAVGADLLDLSEHPLDLPRRKAHLVGRRSVPFAAIAVVLSH